MASAEVGESVNHSQIELLRSLPDFGKRLGKLSDAELAFLAYDWDSWARPSQKLPPGKWASWLILAGRGFGKTRTGAETVRLWHKQGYRYINFIARTAKDLRDVLIEGESGILAVCPPNERPEYQPSKSRLQWPNGAITLLFSAEEPDALRGPQSDKLWCDELASWQYDREAWDMAQFGLRLGDNPQAVITTTPRPTKLIRELIADPNTVPTRGTTYENRGNLAERFYSAIITKYEGTRLGRQELNAEVLDDNPGALWTQSGIEADRVSKLPELGRIVIAVDPAVTAKEESDEWGIVAVGRDRQRPPHYYVFDDLSAVLSPQAAARTVVRAYRQHKADRVVAETNNGGDLVEAVIRNEDENVSFAAVHASRGKIIRAEPVAALYEQHRVHHVGTFATLEAQMCDFNPATDDYSPDRMDALVWGITDLAESKGGVIGYYVTEVAKQKQKTADEKKVPVSTRKWSEPIRQVAMGLVPEITKEQWPNVAGDLMNWIAFVGSEPERLKDAQRALRSLEKKFGRLPGITCDAEAQA